MCVCDCEMCVFVRMLRVVMCEVFFCVYILYKFHRFGLLFSFKGCTHTGIISFSIWVVILLLMVLRRMVAIFVYYLLNRERVIETSRDGSTCVLSYGGVYVFIISTLYLQYNWCSIYTHWDLHAVDGCSESCLINWSSPFKLKHFFDILLSNGCTSMCLNNHLISGAQYRLQKKHTSLYYRFCKWWKYTWPQTDRQTERDGIYLLFYILYRVWLIISLVGS